MFFKVLVWFIEKWLGAPYCIHLSMWIQVAMNQHSLCSVVHSHSKNAFVMFAAGRFSGTRSTKSKVCKAMGSKHQGSIHITSQDQPRLTHAQQSDRCHMHQETQWQVLKMGVVLWPIQVLHALQLRNHGEYHKGSVTGQEPDCWPNIWKRPLNILSTILSKELLGESVSQFLLILLSGQFGLVMVGFNNHH